MGRYWSWAAWVVLGCRAQSGVAVFDDPPGALTDLAEAGAPMLEPAGAARPDSHLDGAGGAPDTTGPGCGAESVTLDEVHSGRVRGGVAVAVGELLASSQKFLLSEAESGRCLWAAYTASALRVGAGAGLLLVSYGPNHADGEPCAAGADALPDDLQPGDVLSAEGVLDEYVPAACEGAAPAQQLRVDTACPVRRSGRGVAPAAAPLDAALAQRLAAGEDAQLLRAWGGALVTLEDVRAVEDPEDGDGVFPFGVVRLAETPLEVHSRLYYFDLSEGGPRSARKTPRFESPPRFERVTGVIFLDYCRWVLAPRDRCADLFPPSDDCARSTR